MHRHGSEGQRLPCEDEREGASGHYHRAQDGHDVDRYDSASEGDGAGHAGRCAPEFPNEALRLPTGPRHLLARAMEAAAARQHRVGGEADGGAIRE